MIVGNDISYAQGVIDWNTYKDNTDFVIIQSSYGNGYFDSQYGNNKGQVLKTGLPHGYYHFAYPQYNAPEDEANWFLHALSAIKPLQDGEVLFLDYEPVGWDGNHVVWVGSFLDTVSNALGGYKPLLYTYQSMLTSNDFSPVSNKGYGLWIAAPTNDPTNNTFQTGVFPFAAMQQWGTQTVPGINGIVDADIFFGNTNAFLAYGYKSNPNPLPPATTSAPATPVVIPEPTTQDAPVTSSPQSVTPTDGVPATQPIISTITPSSEVPTAQTDGVNQPQPSKQSFIYTFLVQVLDFLKSLFKE